MGLGLLLWTRLDSGLPTRLHLSNIRLLNFKKFFGDVLLEHGENKSSTPLKCIVYNANVYQRIQVIGTLKRVSSV